MQFSNFEFFILITLLAIIAAGFITLYLKQNRTTPKNSSAQPPAPASGSGNLLIIQAYERMVTFVSRGSLLSLLERMPANEMDAQQLADVYIASLQAEFEHNLSQQIYLPENTWQAITDMKDQQIFILRQLKNSLPENAPAAMLSMAIQTFLQADPKASLQPMVLELVKNEARQNLVKTLNT